MARPFRESAPTADFVTRKEAITRGLHRYYTGGKRCVKGHDSEKFVSNRGCVKCTHGLPADPPPVDPRRLKNDPKWTDEIRAVLIDEYVNTGDIYHAREIVQISAAAYHRELEANEDFRESIKKATVLAMQTFEDRAINDSRKGNDKLILSILKAKHPDQYSERIKVEATITEKLSDAEIDRRIAKLRGRVIIDHEPIPALPANARRIDVALREIRVADAARREEEARVSQQS